MATNTMTDRNYCASCIATTRGGCWPCKVHAKAADIPRIAKLADKICGSAHKHEVQYWLDEKGTDAEKLERVLGWAREIYTLAKAEGK